MSSAIHDGLSLQIPKPTHREPAPRSFEATRSMDEAALEGSRDLAPARGTVTAVGVGIVLWSAILLTLRSVAS